jgi:hypothetical protein
MVDKFIENTQNTNKKLLLASNYSTIRSPVIRENIVHQNRPSTQLVDATSCINM